VIPHLQAVGLIGLLVSATYGDRPPSVTTQLSDGGHRITGRLDQDYSCFVDATVDGVRFQMLVDTGSDELVFNRSHLRKLGLDAKRLSYSQAPSTSNGLGRSAPILVHSLRIGAFILHDVPAVVDYAGMDEPLLGMSVMKYMHLELDRGGCELRW
jgi:clan AA aspartic protease (TIGR02281 family)